MVNKPDQDRHLDEMTTALRDSEEHLWLLTEAVKDHAIFTMDPHGRVTSWNEGAQRLTGYWPEEVLGRHFALLFTAEDRERGLPRHELHTAAESGNAADENWAARKDGSRFWASGTTTALRDDAGRLRGFAKVFRDLTERQQAQEALRESELRLRAALSAARMGTWLWHIPTDKDTLDESLHRLLGVPEGQTVQTLEEFLAFIHPEDRAAAAEAFRRSAQEGVRLSVEFRVVRPDGRVRWLKDQGELVRDRQGQPLYLTGACVDITDRKDVEEELERRVEERTAELRRSQERALQTERLAAIGQTVTALAHEGRNALQRAYACLSLLGWRLQGQAEALDLAARAGQALDDLQRLFDDVRGYAAPVQLAPRACNLAEVWRQAWAQALAGHPGRDAHLGEETGGLGLACQADPFRLGQVFRILFDNALEACPDPVCVAVSCQETTLDGRPALSVSVRDNGPGLSQEQRQRLFEPFYTTKETGTGLGLAIAQRIVEAHGGKVCPGEGGPGAEIVITLPRRPS